MQYQTVTTRALNQCSQLVVFLIEPLRFKQKLDKKQNDRFGPVVTEKTKKISHLRR